MRTESIVEGQPIEMDYRLYKTYSGWRIYDVNVLGAWMIRAYQQQFSEVINEHGVDGLIQFLELRNQQLGNTQP